MLRNNGYPCLNEIYESSNPFNTLSPEKASTLISGNKGLFILDVRKDSAYKSIASIEKLNAMGRLKGSVNIPITQLPDQLSMIPNHKKILIVDSYGDESVQAATLLAQKGYKDINIVFNGLDNWMSEDNREFKDKSKWWKSPVKYGTISADGLETVLSKNEDVLILDIRTKDEFNNAVKDRTWQNKGHIQNAKNIPLAELKNRMNEILAYKDRDVIVYGFGSSPDAFSSAKMLADNGFTRVKLLANGLFGMRWRAANIKGKEQLMKWVIDVPAENM
jgi:rhodanese-related sulfurtransferase